MGRGYVFEISSDINLYSLNAVNARLMNEDRNLQLECDYFSDEEDPTEIKNLIDSFANILSSSGVTFIESEDNNTQNYRCFRVSIQAKKNYFKNKFDMLRENITNLTLKDFAMNSEKCCRMSSLIDCNYGDAVMFDGSFYTLDNFIRTADPNVIYHLNIKCVVYMH